MVDKNQKFEIAEYEDKADVVPSEPDYAEQFKKIGYDCIDGIAQSAAPHLSCAASKASDLLVEKFRTWLRQKFSA